MNEKVVMSDMVKLASLDTLKLIISYLKDMSPEDCEAYLNEVVRTTTIALEEFGK
jgi:hypothetical protein